MGMDSKTKNDHDLDKLFIIWLNHNHNFPKLDN